MHIKFIRQWNKFLGPKFQHFVPQPIPISSLCVLDWQHQFSKSVPEQRWERPAPSNRLEKMGGKEPEERSPTTMTQPCPLSADWDWKGTENAAVPWLLQIKAFAFTPKGLGFLKG